MDIHDIRQTVADNCKRVAALGKWPPYIPPDSLLERIPYGGRTAPGFDAGVACALNLIPEKYQSLAAALHASYTPEAVEQVREESKDLTQETATQWWLAASSMCVEGERNEEFFMRQVAAWAAQRNRGDLRAELARIMLDKMKRSFKLLTDGSPFGVVDGSIHGAYVAGHPYGVMYNDEFGLFFIGTYLPTLGLEKFPFHTEKDEEGRYLSGPVGKSDESPGSRQFVKCSDFEELSRALQVVKKTLL